MFSNTSKTILVALLLALACAPEGDDRATVPTDVAGGANRTGEKPPQQPTVGGSSAGEGSSGGGEDDSNTPQAPAEPGDPSENGPQETELPRTDKIGTFLATCGKAGTARDEAVGCRVSAASGLAADDRKIAAVYALRASSQHTKIEFKIITGSDWSVVFAQPEGEIDGYAVFHTDATDNDLARDDYVP